MSEATIEQETGLFDGSTYKVPFPQADGREVDQLTLSLRGTIRLNRNDPEHAAFVESLTLGKSVALDVLASVATKGQILKQDADGSETVTHSVVLQVLEAAHK